MRTNDFKISIIFHVVKWVLVNIREFILKVMIGKNLNAKVGSERLLLELERVVRSKLYTIIMCDIFGIIDKVLLLTSNKYEDIPYL